MTAGKMAKGGRNVPRNPRLTEGQGIQYERNYLAGKPRLVGMELHKFC